VAGHLPLPPPQAAGPATVGGRPPPPRGQRLGGPHPGARMANTKEEPQEPDGATKSWLLLAQSAPESAISGAPRCFKVEAIAKNAVWEGSSRSRSWSRS